MCDIFIFAGEASGDTHGANLVEEIKKIDPSLSIGGVAGPKMRKEGVKPLLKMEAFQVMGFTDVLLHFPTLYKNFYLILEWILKYKPKVVVFIDYPGFNLRMAKALRKKGYKGKLIHYICPSVWAWGKGRIEHLAATVDELLTIYPFEKTYFASTSLPVSYIGNPVVESISKATFNPNWRAIAGLPPKEGAPLIALFPGSREAEIKKNLPLQLQAAEKIKAVLPDAQFALSVTSPKIQSVISSHLAESKIKIPIIPSSFNYELMQESVAAIAKSGTITLELALSKCPTTVIYGLTPLNRFVAKYILRLKLPYFCIVNILKNGLIFPELIEKGFDVDTLSKTTLQLIQNTETREKTLTGCQEVIDILGSSSSSKKAAEHVVRQCEAA